MPCAPGWAVCGPRCNGDGWSSLMLAVVSRPASSHFSWARDRDADDSLRWRRALIGIQGTSERIAGNLGGTLRIAVCDAIGESPLLASRNDFWLCGLR